MTHSILCHWFSLCSYPRRLGAPLLAGAAAGCLFWLPLLPARAQEAFSQPDYSKFPVESGPITLEVWSWLAG